MPRSSTCLKVQPGVVARAAATSDAFNAIAEPWRREILALLGGGEWPVTGLARDLGMTQPQARTPPLGHELPAGE